MRAAIRHMLRQEAGGSIVNVLSTAAIRPHANQAIYDISKAASGQATQCAALEYGPDRIRVNGVCPTVVKTAISRPFVDTPGFRTWFRQATTLGEPVDQRQVADAVLFLASDAASAITGVLLPVDMGEALGPILSLKQE
jgi:NAD(P)-dependent dehydrogenase (short-subunit alcohol dehydrogenase family)